jgi:hypothetical protein
MLKSLLLFLLVLNSYSYACQGWAVVVEYPLNNIAKSDLILEVKISESQMYDEGRYTGTKSFRATVLQGFIGTLTAGEIIEAFAANEDASGICPVAIESGKTYILVLSKSKDRFEISRFNAAVSNDHPNYKIFIEQIKRASKK